MKEIEFLKAVNEEGFFGRRFIKTITNGNPEVVEVKNENIDMLNLFFNKINELIDAVNKLPPNKSLKGKI